MGRFAGAMAQVARKYGPYKLEDSSLIKNEVKHEVKIKKWDDSSLIKRPVREVVAGP